MTKVFGALVGILIFIIPVLLVILLIRKFSKKSIKIIMIATITSVGLFVTFTILGVLTNPATWCSHQYEIMEEIIPTCTKGGKVVKKCSSCGNKITNNTKKVAHSWEKVSIMTVTCESDGYTIEKCCWCSSTRKSNITKALGHSLQVHSRIEPTSTSDGELIYECERCDYEERESIPSSSPDDIGHSRGCQHEEMIKVFNFQFQNSTAFSYIKMYCRNCGNGYSYKLTLFRGSPDDLSYLDVLMKNMEGEEIEGGEYYTVTAIVTLADYDFTRTRINCKMESENVIVCFSVEFRDGFEDSVDLLREGDTITFCGKLYEEGCGFMDCELIS